MRYLRQHERLDGASPGLRYTRSYHTSDEGEELYPSGSSNENIPGEDPPLHSRIDSVSYLGTQESLRQLREDYVSCTREIEELRETYQAGMRQMSSDLGKEREYLLAALQESNLRLRHLEEGIEDRLDQFHYASDERLAEVEERLDRYRNRMSRFEELQEQADAQLVASEDIATRGRDVMSSMISLGLALVSLVLFVFTTVVDLLKLVSQKNVLSTGLALVAFVSIVTLYHYLELEGSSRSFTSFNLKNLVFTTIGRSDQ